jgi:hypothetical protein
MNFEEFLLENTDHTHLHVLMGSKSDRNHKGGGKEIAKAHGGEWHSFYSSHGGQTVHVIKIHKDKVAAAKAKLDKEHDVNYVLHHTDTKKVM